METTPQLPPPASRGLLVAAGVTVALLAALSGRYGYHRDELYFLACGRHLAWGYPDQPPLVPALARLMSSLSATSVAVLRLPAELASGWTVVATGLLARELGAGRRGQLLAAAGIAVSGILLATGHLLSTTTFLLTVTVILCLLAARVLRTRNATLWALFGLVTGIGLLDSDLVIFIAGAIVVGVLITGPRATLWSGWLGLGAVAAALLWTPYVVWQGRHGWPQLEVARAISHGGSGTSAPRWQIPVLQLVLSSPLLVPLWGPGLISLLRTRGVRALGVGYLLLLAALLVAGGKPYYLAAFFPLLLAAGAEPAVRWLGRRSPRTRRRLPATVLATAAAANALVTLPVLPATLLRSTPVVAVNYDAGETVAWPTYVHEIGVLFHRLTPAEQRRTVIVARNYGEAGALDRYGAAAGLPAVFSGHNAYWLWGPPPESVTTVLAIGVAPWRLSGVFRSMVEVGRLDNHLGLSTDEQGVRVWKCSGRTRSWAAAWPVLRRYG